MEITIRKMVSADKETVKEMMRVFYASPAVLSNGSEEIFENDIENCVNDSPYLEGYMLQGAEGIQGYGMVAKSFSTEFGKPCIWIEDLYIKESFRGQGIGKVFLDFIADQYPDCLLRLEVEEENERAMKLYKKCGFEIMPYTEFAKNK